VPAAASQGDLLMLIEGKLTEAGRHPLHTQVVLREVAGGTHINLQDETGVFESINPPVVEDRSEGESDESEEEGPKVVALRAEIVQLS